jgi:hypothetical protein
MGRNLVRRLSLVIVLALMLLFVSPVKAASFFASDATSLTNAINAANANGEADTIILTTNIDLTAALPIISSDITIVGNGFTLQRTGVTGFRIFQVSSTGNLTLQNIRVANGSAVGAGTAQLGGAIYNLGTVEVVNSTLDGNSADRGGAIFNDAGTVIVTNSTVSNNTTGSSGGGIYNDGGTVTVSNSTISGNTTLTNSGGAIFNNTGSTVNLLNSTLSNNTAAGSGGGVFNATGSAINVTNTIIANNSASTASTNCGGAAVTNNGGNLSNGGGCTGFGTITPGVDYSTTLANNGGPTATHALLGGSVAVDGSVGGATTYDQRGADVAGAARDIGAFELTPVTLPTVSFATPSTIVNEVDGTVSITLNVTGAINFGGITQVYVADLLTGTATSGVDYNAFPLTVVTIDCTAGCPATVSVNLTVVLDALVEADETVNLAIVATDGFSIIGAPSTHQVIIQDPVPPTNTPTDTPTNTPTFTPTDTPTNTPTFTPTDTPTNTPTGTVTPPTATPIGTVVGPTVTPIGTVIGPTPGPGTAVAGGAAQPGAGFAPVIRKMGFVLSNGQLEWVVTVTGTGATGQSVVITDVIDSQMRIFRIEAPGATVTSSGQTITVTYPTLANGQTVQFSIFTSGVADGATNTACVTAANQSGEVCAVGSSVATLPQTGELFGWNARLDVIFRTIWDVLSGTD